LALAAAAARPYLGRSNPKLARGPSPSWPAACAYRPR